ncbi:hypothetical protein AV540_23985 [Brevibacillus parabrevis]|uniref:DUF4309 domain-containing protein n=1 Tax=Brevibacillus parabrevis TaxID=54914 RepID=UPI0007AC29D4|nr:DUF4309 domain-containing protein [Brevibacillus parabrevis]KZE44546.1 hypothetical protein AV540_23985 [Brevibacillus parabrevis]
MVDLIKTCRNVFLVGIICSMALFGCSKISETSEDKTINAAQSNTLEKVKNGQLEGVSIGIGATKKEVIDKLGKPIEGRNSEYGFSAYYDGFNFQFEDYANSIDEVNDNSKVVMMNAEPKTVGLTGTPEEIKKILGEPSREFMDDAGGDAFILEYESNGNLLILKFDTKDSPVKNITLRIK